MAARTPIADATSTAGSATQTSDHVAAGARRQAPPTLALSVVWSPNEPDRLGQVCVVPPARAGTEFILGRGPSSRTDLHARLAFVRQRAGAVLASPPLAAPKISRVQLLIEPRGVESLVVRNLGRCPLFYNGVVVSDATVVPGDSLKLGEELLLLCVKRPAWVGSSAVESSAGALAEADAHGIVGESAAAWELRRLIAFAAARPEHVLILGESGTGKELTAGALHRLSARANGVFIARNAATFPEALVDAELFGHARNYPNAGMPERPGLIGEAHRGSLFLDEIGELSHSVQAHLLRLLDGGEYQRLGEVTVRTSDFRLIAATNRPEQLRHELFARFKLVIPVPGLDARAEDVPLLAIHLLRRIAATDEGLRARLFPGGALDSQPRITMAFVDRLVRHRYRTHVRELEGLLWRALAEGFDVALGDRADDAGDEDALAESASRGAPAVPRAPPAADEIAETLQKNDWHLERSWRKLGLSSRHALARLIAKHGLKRPRS